MPIFELTSDSIRPIESTTFAAENIGERADLQRLLRGDIHIISPDTLIIAEEFGRWEDSRRRIDLLGVNKDANLVVIELKRTEDGGHMELQALRYAAMISALTFQSVTDIFGSYLRKYNRDDDASEVLLQFLDWEEPREDEFAQDVQIVLASAEFSKELTTSVIWLNERGLDIICMRLKPYRDNDRVLLDVQQVIPLPEAEDYQVKVQEKKKKERSARKSSRDYTKYRVTIGGRALERLHKRHAIFNVVKYLCDQGIKPEEISKDFPKGYRMFCDTDGELNSDEFLEKMQSEVFKGGKRRYFCDEGQLIHSDEKTYAFTNQWGKRTYDRIQAILEKFPQFDISCEAEK